MTRDGAHALARRVDLLGPWTVLGILGTVLALGVRSTNALVENTVWIDHTHQGTGG